jgi:hypothetical protein
MVPHLEEPVTFKIIVRHLEKRKAALQKEMAAVSGAIAALTGTHQPKRDKRRKRMSAAVKQKIGRAVRAAWKRRNGGK